VRLAREQATLRAMFGYRCCACGGQYVKRYASEGEERRDSGRQNSTRDTCHGDEGEEVGSGADVAEWLP